MRTYYYLFILLISIVMPIVSNGQVQSDISRIREKLKTAGGPQRFTLMNDLAWEYRFANPDTALVLSQQAFLFGQKMGITKNLARALNISGLASNYRGNKIIAYDYYIKALDVAIQQNDSVEIGYTYNNLGRIFQEQGVISKALPNITQAFNIFQKINDSTGLAYCYQSFGYLYQAQNNFKQAAENYQRGLALRVRLKNQRNIQGGYYLLGRLYVEHGFLNDALKYLLKSDSIGRLQQDEIQLAENWIYLSKCYFEKGEIRRADSLLNASIRIIRSRKSIRILSNALLIASEMAIKQGHNAKAKSFLREALAHSRQRGDRSNIQDIYFQLWKLSEKTNDRAGSLYNQNQYLLIRDTLRNIDAARKADELNFEREILARENENNNLKLENKAIERQQELQGYFSALFIALIIVVALILWFNLRRRKIIGAQLERKNDQLLQLNEEKDSLMSIVAHDLKSPLNKVQGLSALIKMEGPLSFEQDLHVQTLDRVVRDGQSFISDLLSVHAIEEHRIPEITEFDVADVVKDKIDAAYGVAKNKKIKILQYVQSVVAKSDKEYLGRILDNLISNALKFSPTHSEITVMLERFQDQFLLIVEDSGPGFTEEDKALLFQKFRKLSARPTAGESSNGLGLAIVKTLVDRLGGTIALENDGPVGTKFVVGFPLLAPELNSFIDTYSEDLK